MTGAVPPAAPVTWVTVCDSCRRPDAAPDSAPGTARAAAPDAIADGAVLAGFLDAAAAGHGSVRIRRHSCLMGCPRACNVVVQGKGKLAYSLGSFAPDRETAEAIVAWAALHAESESGQVPYRLWPQGVKGHFVSRHPPLPE